MGAIYCFCFAPAALPTDLDFAACGWEDPIVVRPIAGLNAVLCEVPRDRYTGDAAERRLADLQWLMPRLEAHDRVITQIMAHATVFPLRFATLFSSDQALAIEVAHRRRTLLDFFVRMAGHEEWAIKILLDQDRALAGRMRALFPEAADAPSGGRGYLLRQRQKVQAEQAIGPWLNQRIADLDPCLIKHCVSVLKRPARDPAVANRACLVDAANAPALHAEIARISIDYAQYGLELHCSGPWPLYSFCVAP